MEVNKVNFINNFNIFYNFGVIASGRCCQSIGDFPYICLQFCLQTPCLPLIINTLPQFLALSIYKCKNEMAWQMFRGKIWLIRWKIWLIMG